MKAVRKLAEGPGHVELCEIPEPVCRPGHAKVAVKAGGVCGTDLHILHGGYSFRPPVTLGHEFSGEVVEVGDGVHRVKTGDRVTINPSAMGRCGVCRYCRSGFYFFCTKRASLGSRADGGFAEYAVVPQDLLFLLPEHIDYRAGALTEPLACCVQAVYELTDIVPTDVVLISGPGPIGLIVLTLVKLRGARAIVCGTAQDGERLKIARQFGADQVVEVESEDVVEVGRAMTDGYGVDVAFECAAVAPSVNQCLRALAPLGRLTQVGVIDHPLQIEYGLVLYKQLSVQGALAQAWSTWEKTIRLLSTGTIDVNSFITTAVPLERWWEAFENAEQKRGLKSVLYP
jgi:L-iditol 2-dehydrogenase